MKSDCAFLQNSKFLQNFVLFCFTSSVLSEIKLFFKLRILLTRVHWQKSFIAKELASKFFIFTQSVVVEGSRGKCQPVSLKFKTHMKVLHLNEFRISVHFNYLVLESCYNSRVAVALIHS